MELKNLIKLIVKDYLILLLLYLNYELTKEFFLYF